MLYMLRPPVSYYVRNDGRLNAKDRSLRFSRPRPTKAEATVSFPDRPLRFLGASKRKSFDVVGVKQSKTRDEGKVNFTKHLFGFAGSIKKYKVGETVAEMLLKNANDGTVRTS